MDLVSEVLELQDLGVLDDLISCGMHSLDAMMIAVRIRRTWDLVLPPKVLYSNATIAGLAESLQVIQMEGSRSCA